MHKYRLYEVFPNGEDSFTGIVLSFENEHAVRDGHFARAVLDEYKFKSNFDTSYTERSGDNCIEICYYYVEGIKATWRLRKGI